MKISIQQLHAISQEGLYKETIDFIYRLKAGKGFFEGLQI